MRILVVTSTFPRWNSDTEPAFIFDLCKYLQRQGLVIDVLAPHAHGAKKHEILDGVTVYRYQYFISIMQNLTYSGGIMANLKNNPLNYLLVPFLLIFQIIALFRRLRSTDYQLIHAHWLIPQGFTCALLNSLPGKNIGSLICTSHGGDLYSLDNTIINKIKKWTIDKCDNFCVVSSAMKKKAAALGIAEDKVSIMPMGVDLDNLFIPVPGVDRLRKRLIFVGRLVEKKGVTCLLDAMVDVVNKFPDIELLVVGDGPLRCSLEKQASNLELNNNVNFYGSVQQHQLPDLYSSASIAVVPSIIDSSGDQEGLGLVIIEAMGCNCAIIASSLEAIRDVIDRQSGLLVTPGKPKELADKICYLINNPVLRRNMASIGREKALAHFNWTIAGNRYLQLMHKYQDGNMLD
ncbi:MAG: glycosyltransferase [Gammaproteobacteria bacterium]|jgi:glycosyltransferase involved in cell wall biosynthesis